MPNNTYPRPSATRPSVEEIMEQFDDGECEATDGCLVEPDGYCEHDHPSWLIRLDLI